MIKIETWNEFCDRHLTPRHGLILMACSAAVTIGGVAWIISLF
jgi:hypothetical protein